MNARRVVAMAGLVAALVACSAIPGASVSTAPVASGSSTDGIPDALVGAWTTTITNEDLRTAGITDEAGMAENSGTFTMTIAGDGTWTTSQESTVPLRWPVFKGTTQATGPNSFRQRTTFPADFAGDLVDFTWSIEDGALVLRVVNPPDAVLPIVTESHPWQPKE